MSPYTLRAILVLYITTLSYQEHFKQAIYFDDHVNANEKGSSFIISGNNFVKDGQPFRIVSGAFHYFRVRPEQWSDRLEKMRLGGLNTVETYVPWNLHQPEPNKFDYKDGLDIVRFVKEAQSQGLLVIIRPGPYICAEWEFGGFPYWLITQRVHLRCNDEIYMQLVDKFYGSLLPLLAPLTYQNGGPIILMQVENEYGSYGGDHEYLRRIRDLMINKYKINTPMFASNGASDLMLEGGALPDLLKTVNFGVGDNPATQFSELRKFQKTGPLFATEFWDGWFDHWGENHHTTSPEDTANTLDNILLLNASVNMYMYVGSTNFGFMNGANFGSNYQPTITSYDYDAPINESGDPTPKFFALKQVIKKYVTVPDKNPDVSPKGSYGTVQLTQSANLYNSLDTLSTLTVKRAATATFEELSQDYGFMNYRTWLRGPLSGSSINIQDVRDRALIFLDGTYKGTIDRFTNADIKVDIPQNGATLDILVENLGRINYGELLAWDHKGITLGAKLDYQFLFNWTISSLPLKDISSLSFEPFKKYATPGFYRGTWTIASQSEILDTFVELPGWTKGVVWVNNFNLGRYWNTMGPQKTLYLPAPLLRVGSNEIVVFELHGYQTTSINLIPYSILG